jgi:hypothetical protein
MPVTIINGPVIAAGESLSSGVDCSAGRIIRITTPAGWTGANISFQVSSDGLGYEDLFTAAGNEVTIPCGPSRAISISQQEWPEAVHLKIRSGRRDNPVPQAAQREFSIALLTPNP